MIALLHIVLQVPGTRLFIHHLRVQYQPMINICHRVVLRRADESHTSRKAQIPGGFNRAMRHSDHFSPSRGSEDATV